MNKLFLALAALTLLLVGVAAAKDSHDRQYLSIQDQYKADYPACAAGAAPTPDKPCDLPFDTKVQQLFPSFAEAKRGDTFRVERCISCHVPNIAAIGPDEAAKRLAADFKKYEPDADHLIKAFNLTLQHPARITQQLYATYGEESVATSDGFHPYVVQGANGPEPAQLSGFIPKFLSPAQNGGKELGIDQVGCIVCHNGSRLALDDTHAHQNLVINPEYSWSAGAALYYQNCAVCHGNLGEGKVGPPLSNQDRLGFFNEDYYYRCIEYGNTDFEHIGSVMPAWGSAASDWSYDPSRDQQSLAGGVTRKLSEDQIHLLVQFIRHWEQYDTLP